jgi:site-specific DNA recombinase
MNCIVYARVSTTEQAEKELSIPAQLQAMRDYARQHGWSVVEEFNEPGASGKTTDRPGLQRLLTYVRETALKIDVVLVHKIDRLARNVYDHATIRALLQQRGIRLASVVENVDDSVSGQLVENIMASIAQFYSANLSDETRKGMRQKALKGGWPHRPPRGYIVVKGSVDSHSRIEIHPREGPLMRKAFELYASGWYSVESVCRRLAAEGLISKSGGPIPKSHMHRLLTNPFYVARIVWKDIDVAGAHPALVSEELFQSVQTIIEERFRNPGTKTAINRLPLRGLAICASCRGRMSGEWHDRWGYYRCGRQSYRRELCPSRMCNATRAHADLKRICLQVQISRATAKRLRTAAARLIQAREKNHPERLAKTAAAQAEISTAETELTNAFASGDINPADYNIHISSLRARREALKRATTDISGRVREEVYRTLEVATSLWDLYERFDDRRQAKLLRVVFETVVIGQEGILGFTLKPSFKVLEGVDAAGSDAIAAALIESNVNGP